jgi:hypothetical protein
LRNQLLRWKKQGWVVMLRRGLYALGPDERKVGLSRELIAASLYKPSYVSLESALSYYKMIPEKVAAITSVTARKTKTFENAAGLFVYRHLKKDAYFGFRLVRDAASFPYFLAEPEKALLDYLYLKLGRLKVGDSSYFAEDLRLQNTGILNKRKLFRYAARFNRKKLLKILESLK